MRKQNANSIPGEERAKTRVSAHASPEIAPPRAAADARAAYYYYYYCYVHSNRSRLLSLAFQLMAVHCTGASRALRPQGRVPLRIAANSIRMGSVSMYMYPPPVTQPKPWAQVIQAKLVIRSAGPVPSPG